jgi:hypothetical protein
MLHPKTLQIASAVSKHRRNGEQITVTAEPLASILLASSDPTFDAFRFPRFDKLGSKGNIGSRDSKSLSERSVWRTTANEHAGREAGGSDATKRMSARVRSA